MGSIVKTSDLFEVGPSAPGPTFTYTFAKAITDAAIEVWVAPDNASAFVLQTEGALNDYTLDTSASQITFTAGNEPATGAYVRIQRCTKRTRTVDYVGGSTLTAEDLDQENIQEFYILQELENGTDLDGVIVGNYMTKHQNLLWWVGEGIPIKGIADGVANDDAATVGQLNAAGVGGGFGTAHGQLATDLEWTGGPSGQSVNNVELEIGLSVQMIVLSCSLDFESAVPGGGFGAQVTWTVVFPPEPSSDSFKAIGQVVNPHDDAAALPEAIMAPSLLVERRSISEGDAVDGFRVQIEDPGFAWVTVADPDKTLTINYWAAGVPV